MIILDKAIAWCLGHWPCYMKTIPPFGNSWTKRLGVALSKRRGVAKQVHNHIEPLWNVSFFHASDGNECHFKGLLSIHSQNHLCHWLIPEWSSAHWSASTFVLGATYGLSVVCSGLMEWMENERWVPTVLSVQGWSLDGIDTVETSITIPIYHIMVYEEYLGCF